MKNLISLEEFIESKYGKKGTEKRDKFDSDSLAFRLGVMLKEARLKANLTQEVLAQRTGIKRSLISKIERGLIDIDISTYSKLVETGIGSKLKISIKD